MASDSPAETNTSDSKTDQRTFELFKMVTVDGDIFASFPVNIPIADHVHNINKMPMREDDVIIAAYPKCGTHWLWEMVQMLTTGRAKYHSYCKEQVMIEFNEVELFETLPSPRVLNSHLFLKHLSKELVTNRSRVIHVIRNPKDVAVSMYYHFLQLNGVDEVDMVTFLQIFLHGGVAPGSFLDYFAYMHEMMKWQEEHPDHPIINIYYEDARKDPVDCVRRLAQFLKVDASEELCADIADRCSFKKLKEAAETIKDKNSPEIVLYKDRMPKLYRKGEVGDWKNYFTVALSELYDQTISEQLKNYHFKMQYTI